MALIDRDALLDKLQGIPRYDGLGLETVMAVSDVVDLINAMPEAEPVAHGRWLERTVRGSKSLVCSVCRSDAGTICELPRCSFCGAIMDLGVD